MVVLEVPMCRRIGHLRARFGSIRALGRISDKARKTMIRQFPTMLSMGVFRALYHCLATGNRTFGRCPPGIIHPKAPPKAAAPALCFRQVGVSTHP